jgi:hypothetical protein
MREVRQTLTPSPDRQVPCEKKTQQCGKIRFTSQNVFGRVPKPFTLKIGLRESSLVWLDRNDLGAPLLFSVYLCTMLKLQDESYTRQYLGPSGRPRTDYWLVYTLKSSFLS